MEGKKAFSLGLTFDDVLLLPGYTDFSRKDIVLSTQLTKTLRLSVPFVSSPMDTVTESRLATVLAQEGGIGIIHRNLSIQQQAREVKKVKSSTSSGRALLVGAAIGASPGFEERVEAVVRAGADVIVVDSAHGYSKNVIETTRYIKRRFSKAQVIAGNIATFDGARALIAAGADALRVGMGPGAICTTRVISGMGVPQITSLFETLRAARAKKIPVIADGGIKYSGDAVKTLAAGASAVMMGGIFAATRESPGEVVELKKEEVPHRFQSIFNHTHNTYPFKSYRGMGSIGAMRKAAKIKAEDEFHGKSYKERVLVAEGVEGYIPLKGTVKEVLDQFVGGIRSGMYYVGARTIPELQRNAHFIQITNASLIESHPHSLLVTNPGKNY